MSPLPPALNGPAMPMLSLPLLKPLAPLLLAVGMAAVLPVAAGAATTMDPTRLLAQSQAAFAVELTRVLAAGAKGGTVLISPLSLSAGLAMAAAGADEAAGRAIAATLRLPAGQAAAGLDALAAAQKAAARQQPGTALRLAGGVWTNEGFTLTPAFAESVTRRFGAKVESRRFADPETLAAINAWASEATAGKVPALLGDLPADGQAVLATAMHFKGQWTVPFDPARTAEGTFTTAAGEARKVPMMTLDGGPIAYRESQTLQAVDLGFGAGDLRLVVMLPRKRSISVGRALAAVARDPDWLAGEGFQPRPGTLRLPRFTADARTELKKPLAGLGLTPALRPGAFTGMGTPAPSLSAIVHQASFSVDEQGAEAAAATAVVMGRSARIEKPFAMTCDRPFIVSLYQMSTGAILLVGVIGAV